MTWAETIAKTEGFLCSKGVPDARVAAELLSARLLRIGRGMLTNEYSQQVAAPQLEAMRRAMRRLAAGEPLQYVLGEWDFRTLTLKCDRRALIPRPETEELVGRVLKFLNSEKRDGRVIVDVGTGTGAIILSIAKEYQGDALLLGTDLSEDAIALAKENAALCGLADKVRFAVADGLDDFDESGVVDVIISNPPYIESAVCDTLDPRVRDWEPRMALDGGASGLEFYERYLFDALNLLKSGGAVFFEIGENQGAALSRLMFEYGFEDIKVEKDYAGHDRYASARLP
jgi:release factor glutamine methyltransferase